MNNQNKKGITPAHVISLVAIVFTIIGMGLTIWGIILNLEANQAIATKIAEVSTNLAEVSTNLAEVSTNLAVANQTLATTTRMSTITWVTANLNRETWVSYLAAAKMEAIPSPYIMLDGGIAKPDKKGRDLLENELLGKDITDKVIELKSLNIPCESYRVIRRLGVLPLYNKFIDLERKQLEREKYPRLSMDILMVLIDSYVQKVRHNIKRGKIIIPEIDGERQNK